ncbi:MAG: hypothetical protein ABIQ63_06610 [Rhodanobacter sp.]
MSDPRADSVRARLLQRARQHGEDFNLLLTRYALERWLYRLSVSDQRAGFVLKGALLFSLWFDEPHRPTMRTFRASMRPMSPSWRHGDRFCARIGWTRRP